MRVRDGPAAVRGVARPPKRHWPTGVRQPGRWWEREPRVRRPAASSIPNPSWKEDSWHDVRLFSWPLSALLSCSPLRRSAQPSRCASKERPSRSSDRCPSRSTHQRARRTRRREHARRVLLRAHGKLVRHLREPDRKYPPPGRRLGVQGQRRLATGGCRPGRAQGWRSGALVLRHVRRHRRPEDAVSQGRDGELLHGHPSDDAGKSAPAAGAQLLVDGRTKAGANGGPASARTSGWCGPMPSAPSGRTP